MPPAVPPDDADDVTLLARWLRDHACSDVLLPVEPASKAPIVKHAAPGAWTWSKFHAFRRDNPTHADFAIALKSLCAIDVDCAAVATELERRFPILEEVPRETTARGVHYLFARSPLCDADGYYDARSPVARAVDFKSRAATGTGGVLVVAPAAGKRWTVAPWTRAAPVQIPDDLLRAVAAPSHPPRDLAFECARGEIVERAGSRRLAGGAYVDMFLGDDLDDSGEADAVPLVKIHAFEAAAVAAAMDGLETGRVACEDPDLAAEALRVLDFAGYPARRVREVADATREFAALRAVHPAMARATLRDDAPGETLVDVDRALAATLEREVPALGACEIRLRGGRGRERRRRGELVLDPDPSEAVRRALPPYVLEWLREFPGLLVVAGGAVTGAVVARAPPGADVDLYVATEDVARADAVVERVRGDPRVRSCAFTGYALTMVARDDDDEADEAVVQVVLVLNPGADAVVRGFDVHPARALAYADADGDVFVRATATWVESARAMAFPVLDGYWTDSSVARLAKYAAKGFAPYVPGLDRDKVGPVTWAPRLSYPMSTRSARFELRDALRGGPRGVVAVFALERFYEHARDVRRVDDDAAYDEFLKIARDTRTADYRAAIVRRGVLRWILAKTLRRWFPASDAKGRDGAIHWRTFSPGARCRARHLVDSGLHAVRADAAVDERSPGGGGTEPTPSSRA